MIKAMEIVGIVGMTVAVILALTTTYFGNKNCEAEGGTYVRALYGMKCIKKLH